jgi:hypothetical protein
MGCGCIYHTPGTGAKKVYPALIRCGIPASVQTLPAPDVLTPTCKSGRFSGSVWGLAPDRNATGGVKRSHALSGSGYGRELSHYGIKEFVNIKTVFV